VSGEVSMKKVTISSESLGMTISMEDDESQSEEKALTTKVRNKLPKSAFGLKTDEKFPLYKADGTPDIPRIKSAMTYFHKCEEAKKPELARAILKAAKVAKMKINKDTDVFKYL
jgi:hypothetical protein